MNYDLQNDKQYSDGIGTSQEGSSEIISHCSLPTMRDKLDSLHSTGKENNDNTTQGDYEQSSFVAESSILGTKSKRTDLFSSHRPTTHLTSMTSVSHQTEESKERVADSADRLTIRSQFDVETLNLEEGHESQLIAIFVEALFQAIHSKLGYMPEPEGVKEPVAELLKSYAILVQRTVASQNPFDKTVVDFVRSRRM